MENDNEIPTIQQRHNATYLQAHQLTKAKEDLDAGRYAGYMTAIWAGRGWVAGTSYPADNRLPDGSMHDASVIGNFVAAMQVFNDALSSDEAANKELFARWGLKTRANSREIEATPFVTDYCYSYHGSSLYELVR